MIWGSWKQKISSSCSMKVKRHCKQHEHTMFKLRELPKKYQHGSTSASFLRNSLSRCALYWATSLSASSLAWRNRAVLADKQENNSTHSIPSVSYRREHPFTVLNYYWLHKPGTSCCQQHPAYTTFFPYTNTTYNLTKNPNHWGWWCTASFMGNTSHQRPKDLTLLPLNSNCTKSLDPQTQWELLACASLIMNLVRWNWTSSRS